MLKTVSTANGLVSPTFSGNVTLSDGNLIIGTSGKGVDFSATPGTGTSELLSDYEEGNWTPTLEGNDVNFTSITYDAAVFGTYVKVGKVVHVQGLMRTDAVTVGAAATYVIIGGLPFTPVNSACLSVSDVENWTVNNPSFLRIQASNTYMFIQYRTTANGAYSLLTPVAVATGADSNIVRFSGTYITS